MEEKRDGGGRKPPRSPEPNEACRLGDQKGEKSENDTQKKRAGLHHLQLRTLKLNWLKRKKERKKKPVMPLLEKTEEEYNAISMPLVFAGILV